MNCEKARELLSAYHDGELPTETAEQVGQHVQQCSVCGEKYRGFQSLSELAKSLSDPENPPAWSTIEDQLVHQDSRTTLKRLAPLKNAKNWRRMLVAAAGLLILVITFVWSTQDEEAHDHGPHLAVNFDSYLTLFSQQPQEAQHVLVHHYQGEPVSISQATRRLPYRPLAAIGPPPGYEFDTAYLLNMPCCKCLQAIYINADQHRLALFEHEADQPIWFGDRPALLAECGGTTCRIVQFQSHLAVTCPLGVRYATIVGARSLEEVVQIVEHYRPKGTSVARRLTSRHH